MMLIFLPGCWDNFYNPVLKGKFSSSFSNLNPFLHGSVFIVGMLNKANIKGKKSLHVNESGIHCILPLSFFSTCCSELLGKGLISRTAGI